MNRIFGIYKSVGLLYLPTTPTPHPYAKNGLYILP